jgi:hypothetical protein
MSKYSLCVINVKVKAGDGDEAYRHIILLTFAHKNYAKLYGQFPKNFDLNRRLNPDDEDKLIYEYDEKKDIKIFINFTASFAPISYIESIFKFAIDEYA